MYFGMGLMVVGYAAVIYGLAPRFSRGGHETSELEFEALEESKLTAAHIKLMLVLMLAVAVDTQKPFTFTFILPGVASEYNLRSPSHPAPGHWPVALFPFVAIVGTVVGSLIWGRLGDSIGRRASILLAATLFIGTAMCSAMPAFHWNLVACFFMGMSAGGLLPIAYSLLAETIPARRRGEAIVLVAGLGTALGFLLASWTAHWLIPTYGWRIMWFFGVPTGLALILLNRYIPESPRFLFASGRADEARAVMRSFGLTVKERQAADPEPAFDSTVKPGFASVFRRPYTAITPVLIVYGLAWGLVNYGFLVWLPVYVAKSGVSAGQVTTILAKAALFSIPGSVARRLALRPLEQPRHAHPRGRPSRPRRSSSSRSTRRSCTTRRSSPRCSCCCSCRCGRPSRRSRRTPRRSIRPRSAVPARASSPARRSSAACVALGIAVMSWAPPGLTGAARARGGPGCAQPHCSSPSTGSRPAADGSRRSRGRNPRRSQLPSASARCASAASSIR